MRYFLDTEFIESGYKRPIYLISLALKCEDGREYYAEDQECPLHLANDWVSDNVVPKLHHSKAQLRWMITKDVLQFIAEGDDKPPSFWGYFADYDWVVFAQLFGAMVDMPHRWPKYCLDIKQVWKMLGCPALPADPRDEHHALADANWNHSAWLVVNEIWRNKMGVDLP